MGIRLDKHQLQAVDRLKNGAILNGGVGSGKSRASLAYYFLKIGKGELIINECGDYKPMSVKKDLYIITTARKRDTLDWEREAAPFGLTTNSKLGINKMFVDSWHNIKKYVDVKDSFFIFDEQRLTGSGAWVKSFYKIVKNNEWILLSATPGDNWMDYIPVFVANGFYKNKTEFIRKHVIYNPFVKFPMVDRYVNTGILMKHRQSILVPMKYKKTTNRYYKNIYVGYDKKKYDILLRKRWNIFTDKPVKNISELSYALRRVVNSDPSRIKAMRELTKKHDRIIIFYNFNYELEILRNLADDLNIKRAEWNGHKHEPIPKLDRWLYLVQYTSGAEGWNCIETNATVFYSQTYSYKVFYQASGRIDRRNTPYEDLYYYTLISKAGIDRAISKTLNNKEDFNESAYFKKIDK